MIEFFNLTKDEILAKSKGEVKSAKMINMRTGKPIKGGLFDPRIFGSPRLHACPCGALDDAPTGSRCGQCGGEVEDAGMHLMRYGHVTLACPMPHPLYASLICKIFKWKKKKYSDILNGDCIEIGELDEQIGAEYIVWRLSSADVDKLDLADDAWTYPFISGRSKLSDLILEVLVVPAAPLRPVFRTRDGRWVVDRINEKYRRVITLNNNIIEYKRSGVPNYILSKYVYILYNAIEDLFNEWIKRLQGKRGWLRHELLGRRIDYSGRAVIIQDNQLPLDGVRLPTKMAVALYEPLIVRRLIREGRATGIHDAKLKLARPGPAVERTIAEVIDGQVVWLNRQPTLHQLGLLAARVSNGEGDVIGIHPALCHGYNADFDGDQMAVYVPLGDRAKGEGRERGSVTAHMARPADGAPAWAPSKDYLLGAADWRKFVPPARYEALAGWQQEHLRRCGEEVERRGGRKAWREFLGALHSCMVIDANHRAIWHRYMVSGITEYYKNKNFNKWVSISLLDLDIPMPEHVWVERLRRMAERGLISVEEAQERALHEAYEALGAYAGVVLAYVGDDVRTLIELGATKGGETTVGNLVGGYGVLRGMSGEVLYPPLARGLLHGLSPSEYVQACRAQRRGLYDTYEGTARSGYLTRRLIEVMQVVRVTGDVCGDGQAVCCAPDGEMMWRASWHVCARPDEAVGIKAGEVVTPMHVQRAVSLGRPLWIYTPLGCGVDGWRGVCARCYGLRLSDLKMAEVGDYVGVIAAQAVGEPITQSALRAFYSPEVGEKAKRSVGVGRWFERPAEVADGVAGWTDRLLRWLIEAGGVVHAKHLALIGRVLYQRGRGEGIGYLAKRMRSPLARMSYQDAHHEILKCALYRSVDDLSDVKSMLMVGRIA